MKQIKIGIIGAGAVAEINHLPAAQRSPEVKIVAIVDLDLKRARSLAAQFGVSYVTQDYRDLFGKVDGVINALPNYLHAPISIEFLRRKIAVLVEKPMALNAAEANAMIQTAHQNHSLLAVGLQGHFFRRMALIKQALDEGLVGRVAHFSLEWGFPFSWPLRSGYLFDPKQAGGGVLIDLGSHALGLLSWWFGNVMSFEYWDDSQAGVESECRLSLSFQHGAGMVKGVALLSRLRQLRNVVCIMGEQFVLECDLATNGGVRFTPDRSEVKGSLPPYFDFLGQQSDLDLCVEQLRNFSRAIAGAEKLKVPAEKVLATVSLIEGCYRERKPLASSWKPELFHEVVAKTP